MLLAIFDELDGNDDDGHDGASLIDDHSLMILFMPWHPVGFWSWSFGKWSLPRDALERVRCCS